MNNYRIYYTVNYGEIKTLDCTAANIQTAMRETLKKFNRKFRNQFLVMIDHWEVLS